MRTITIVLTLLLVLGWMAAPAVGEPTSRSQGQATLTTASGDRLPTVLVDRQRRGRLGYGYYRPYYRYRAPRFYAPYPYGYHYRPYGRYFQSPYPPDYAPRVYPYYYYYPPGGLYFQFRW